MGTNGRMAFGTAPDRQPWDQTAGGAGTMVTGEHQFLVLNSVVLKKMATAATLAEATSLPVQEVEAVLDILEAEDAVARVDPHVMATETGVAEVKAYADGKYGDLRNAPGMEVWLAEFHAVNQRLLQATTAWQTLPVGEGRVPNDHSDPAYDARVISRIEKLVDKAGRLLDEIAPRLPRFTRYRERLRAAMERIHDGDTKYVSSPLADSIHTVWFEMHEDILIVFGKERTE